MATKSTKAKVTIKFAGGVDLYMVLVDNKRVHIKNGKGDASVSAGMDFALTWFTRGAPGTKYSLEVTSPPQCAFKHEETIDKSTKAGGVQWLVA